MMKKWELSRRTFLRGFGTSLALPMLEAMIPSVARGAVVAPQRFLAIYFANGVINAGAANTSRNYWSCTGTETNWQLSRTLAALAPYKDYVMPISNLYTGTSTNSGTGHWESTTYFLTGSDYVHSADQLSLTTAGAKSIDQMIADKISAGTPMRILTMGAQPVDPSISGLGNSDSRGSSSYLTRISWESQFKLASRYDKSVDIFNELVKFAGSPTQSDQAAQMRRAGKKSVLDFVLAEINSLKTKLGTSDQRKLDEYLTSIQEVERGIAAETAGTTGPACNYGTKMTETWPLDNLRSQNMANLLTIAFQCDTTRVSTMMLSTEHNFYNVGTYTGGGLNGEHHPVSHYLGDDGNHPGSTTINECVAMNEAHTKQFAYFLKKLSETTDVDGRKLLDNTAIMYGTGMGDSHDHMAVGQAVVLAGKGAGFRPGRFVNAGTSGNYGATNSANLLRGILYKFGIDVAKVGVSNGRIDNI